MPDIRIIAAGRVKSGPERDLCEEYIARLRWPVAIVEIESRIKDAAAMNADENRKIREKIRDRAFVIALDSRGRDHSSEDFAAVLRKAGENSPGHVDILIGGADGLNAETRSRANIALNFGKLTWPHRLARIMLLEQIYQAQQILAGHPYHRA